MGENPARENRHSPLIISALEPALLVLLLERPRHGYTLLADLDSLGMSTIHPSVVYRTLREMEGLDWVVSDWDTTQTQGPPRRIYRLSRQGVEALQNWKFEMNKTREILTNLISRAETGGEDHSA